LGLHDSVLLVGDVCLALPEAQGKARKDHTEDRDGKIGRVADFERPNREVREPIDDDGIVR
jgi:hypothetical protein